MWCRFVSKTGYLFEFDTYTDRKVPSKLGIGKLFVLQLT